MKKISIVIVLLHSAYVLAVPFVDRAPFDINFRSHIQRVKKHELLLIPRFAFSGQGRDSDGHKVNPLQYLQATQDALAMLKGFTAGSIEDQIAQEINVYDDDGVRGHFVIDGNYSFDSVVCGYSYHLFNEWFLRARIPFVTANITNTTWKDETLNTTYDDMLTHQLVTDQLASNVKTWGDLRITDWRATGQGDLTTYIQWERVFLQEKAWLKEVAVNGRLGMCFPTGKRKDEDVAFSYAFGNDGAWAVPFGAGIDLKFKKFLRVGIDVAFEHMFSHTKNRRIMTDPAQTDFLFLQKAHARKEYGITQMFNLFLEPQLFNTVTVRFAYQHTKHGNDRLYLLSNDFSSIIANKSAGLKEWTTHNAFIQVRYDNDGTRGLISPIISVFAQVPFNGKRSLSGPTVGFNAAIHF